MVFWGLCLCSWCQACLWWKFFPDGESILSLVLIPFSKHGISEWWYVAKLSKCLEPFMNVAETQPSRITICIDSSSERICRCQPWQKVCFKSSYENVSHNNTILKRAKVLRNSHSIPLSCASVLLNQLQSCQSPWQTLYRYWLRCH